MNNFLPATPLQNAFLFNHSEIRTAIDEHGSVWFCAKDVFEALDITWNGTGTSLRNYPEEWVCTLQLRGQSGSCDVVFLSEPAVYRVLFRSNKPEAVQFANWVCEEVLPSIRKQGYYGQLDSKQRLAISKQISVLASRLPSVKDAFEYEILTSEVRDLCNVIGRPVPDLALLGTDRKQLHLGV